MFPYSLSTDLEILVFFKNSLYKGYVYIINMSDSQGFQTNTGFVFLQNLVIFLGAIFIKPVFF